MTDCSNFLQVVPNKFPAFAPLTDASPGMKKQMELARQSLLPEVEAFGFHEVVIETPRHNGILALSTQEELELLVKAWRERSLTLSRQAEVKHTICFKNQGGGAGASLLHPHAQIVGFPLVPQPVQARIEFAREQFQKVNDSVFSLSVAQELEKMERGERHRIIDHNDMFVAGVPFAAKSPYSITILPKPQASTLLFIPNANAVSTRPFL